MRKALGGVSIGVLVAAMAAASDAQSIGGSTAAVPGNAPVQQLTPQAPNAWGGASTSLSIGATSFVPEDTSGLFSLDFSTAGKYCTGGSCRLDLSLLLPTGASLDQVQFEVYDNNAGADVGAELFVCNGVPAGTGCINYAAANTSGQPGWVYLVLNPAPLTIDNYNNHYGFEVFLNNDGGLSEFRRLLLYYHVQVSPAPGSATFNDVPTSDPAFQFIEALVASGITAGCGGGNYCPDAPLTRRQMAVFISKAFGLYWAN